ncbi:MAG: lysoplasmalogenase [Nocardioides sp.]|nr:lysoplasmalogenase [Nocardioides sp.]
MTTLPGAAYVALSVADTVAAGLSSSVPLARRLRYVLKPALMPTLAVALRGATAGGPRNGLRAGTLAAQAFSWGGDVALLGKSRSSFLAGVGSFAAAHVAYIAAFSSVRGEPEDHDTAALKASLGLWLTAAPVMGLAAGRQDPALRVPVAAYATLLVAMFASSHVLDAALPRGARRSVQAGTALFVLSDTVLAAQEFGLLERRPVLESLVMATYTAGQGLIAAGVARA